MTTIAIGARKLGSVPIPSAIGIMPAPITTFTAGICTGSLQADAARAMLAYMASPEATEAKRRQGMAPA